MTASIKKHHLSFLVDNTTDRYKWWIKNFPDWEDETFIIFDKLLDKEKTFVDIGAWIGTTSLYGAKLSKYVYSIEADPISLSDMKKNVLVNSFENIKIVNKAIHNEKKTLFFGPPSKISKWNSSSSRIKNTKNNKFDIAINTITFEELIKNYQINDISLIKVDIEGAEENIIPDIFNYVNNLEIKPSIYLSFHLGWWVNKDLGRFSGYWNRYKYVYYKLKSIDHNSITQVIGKDPFGSMLYSDEQLQFDPVLQ